VKEENKIHQVFATAVGELSHCVMAAEWLDSDIHSAGGILLADLAQSQRSAEALDSPAVFAVRHTPVAVPRFVNLAVGDVRRSPPVSVEGEGGRLAGGKHTRSMFEPAPIDGRNQYTSISTYSKCSASYLLAL